jgi:hypothetical protein
MERTSLIKAYEQCAKLVREPMYFQIKRWVGIKKAKRQENRQTNTYQIHQIIQVHFDVNYFRTSHSIGDVRFVCVRGGGS